MQWTQVRAPLGGRISDRKVDVGNLVAGGQGTATTLLTTIVRLDPIYFVFEASEADYMRYTRLAAAGGRASSRDAPTPVQIHLADETDWPHRGVMNFVDNQLNARSGDDPRPRDLRQQGSVPDARHVRPARGCSAARSTRC